MTGETVVPGEPQTPDRDLQVVHQAAGVLRAVSGAAIDDTLRWLSDAALTADLTVSGVARSIIRAAERRHAALRN